MKKCIPPLILFTVCIALSACSPEEAVLPDRPAGALPPSAGEPDDPFGTGRRFSIEEAKNYFETEIGEVQPLDLYGAKRRPDNPTPLADYRPKCGPLLIPLWNEAAQTGDNGYIMTVEIPLKPNGWTMEVSEAGRHPVNAASWRHPVPSSTMVMHKYVEGDSIMCFVVTFLPDSACYNERKFRRNPYRFKGNRGFEGFTIISEIDGSFSTAFLDRGGKCRRVGMNPPGSHRSDTAAVIGFLTVSERIDP